MSGLLVKSTRLATIEDILAKTILFDDWGTQYLPDGCKSADGLTGAVRLRSRRTEGFGSNFQREIVSEVVLYDLQFVLKHFSVIHAHTVPQPPNSPDAEKE